MSYKNSCPWLFLLVIHLDINVYLDGGNPGTSGGFDMALKQEG